MALHSAASRRGAVVAGLAALAVITTWGQPAVGTAPHAGQTGAGTSAVDSHPFTKARQRTVRVEETAGSPGDSSRSGSAGFSTATEPWTIAWVIR